MNKTRILILAVLVLAGVAFFALDLGQHFSLAAVQGYRDQLLALYAEQPLGIAALYFAAYVLMAGLSIPGATVLTLLAGALFGVAIGTVLVSFASTLGATLAFVLARFLFRDAVQARFARFLEPLDRGMRREGGLYLFAVRLVPVFPFFVVNLVMALTGLRTWTFAWVSQLGMLPATVVYVNAGVQLGSLESLGGILTPGFIGAFVALGLLPLLSRRLLDVVRRRRQQSGYTRPRRFDNNLVVIGAGAAGLVSAYIGAAVRARVTLVERHRMGGDCLYTGCVPSKALIRAARVVAEARRAASFGIHLEAPRVDFGAVMARVREVITTIEPHDSVARYTALGVHCVQGEARIVSPWCVEIDGQPVTTRAIIIAAGARPLVPPVPGLDELDYRTSESIWTLQALPRRLLVLGGGPIGCELAQAFARLGAQVSLVEMAPSLLAREEPEFGVQVGERLRAEGVNLYLGQRAERVRASAPGQAAGTLTCSGEAGEQDLDFDVLLVAVGRKPNVEGYGLEALGIGTGAGGVVETDEYLRTLHPNIYACGDVAGPFQFTHSAAHQAWYAAVNALFGGWRRFAADYRVMPRVTYTDPEVAAVGLGEAEARARGLDYEVTRYALDDLDRAIVDGAAHGEVKVLTARGSDRIIGAHIMGAHAGELIAEFTLAMRHGLGLKKILGTIHAYPTMMEAAKYTAGNWSRAHAPARLLDGLERYHAWRRGA